MFFKEKITFLGQKINADGLRPNKKSLKNLDKLKLFKKI